MSKELSTGEKIALGAALVGGGYLLYKLLVDKKPELYQCGNCGQTLKIKYKKCPRCGYYIEWG